MSCMACGKNPMQWVDYHKDVGKFGFCVPCVRKYMPHEFEVMNICSKCNKMFVFKFPTQNICGSCFYKSKSGGLANATRVQGD